MLDLLQITNDPVFARRCDALSGGAGRMRLFVDLERLGKAERQAGRNTFISAHQVSDVGYIKAQLKHSQLMVRVNPVNPATKSEVNAVFAQGLAATDLLMLPMFTSAAELRHFSAIVAGRCPIVALLETAGALATLDDWLATPGLSEVFVGLNDLHLSLGLRFMFEPLANGIVDRNLAAQRQSLAGHSSVFSCQATRFGYQLVYRVDIHVLNFPRVTVSSREFPAPQWVAASRRKNYILMN